MNYVEKWVGNHVEKWSTDYSFEAARYIDYEWNDDETFYLLLDAYADRDGDRFSFVTYYNVLKDEYTFFMVFDDEGSGKGVWQYGKYKETNDYFSDALIQRIKDKIQALLSEK